MTHFPKTLIAAALACFALPLAAQDAEIVFVAGEDISITGPVASPEGPPLLGNSHASWVACYFETSPTRLSWQWALKRNNKWFETSGSWISAPLTKNAIFRSSDATHTINAACENARRYYKVDGKLVARLAGTTTNNYPLIADGVHLDPEY